MISFYRHESDGIPSQLIASAQRPKLKKYRHSFGGSLQHRVLLPAECHRPPHLLHTLDLSDDSLAIQIPNARMLPFLYAFQYDASPMYYRVESDDEVMVVRLARTTWTDDFPYKDYPTAFPFRWVSLFDPIKIDECLGNEDIHSRWKELLIERHELGQTTNQNDMISIVTSMPQGAPMTRCINDACDGCEMDIIGVIEADVADGLLLWGSGAPEIQIVYEMCPKCKMIYVNNQCT